MKRPHSKGDLSAIARQKRLLKEVQGNEESFVKARRKKHVYDCGNTECQLCHGDKYPVRYDTRQEIQSEIDLKESIEEENL